MTSELCRLLGSRARKCDGRTPPDATAARTPCETSANPGTAWLVLGSELSNRQHNTHSTVKSLILRTPNLVVILHIYLLKIAHLTETWILCKFYNLNMLKLFGQIISFEFLVLAKSILNTFADWWKKSNFYC